MPHCEADNGGCWFCRTDDKKDGWLFSMEWDAFYHPKCLKKAWLEGSEEARIIVAHEFTKADMKAFNAL
jgi:hypothetical protein